MHLSSPTLQRLSSLSTTVRSHGPVLLIFCYVFIYMSPMLMSGYSGDDLVWTTTIHGYFKLHPKMTLCDGVASEIIRWLRSGRFLPIGVMMYIGIFYFIENVIIYKALVLIMVMLNIWLFYIILRRLHGHTAFSLISILSIPALFQFRTISYHDPILAMHCLMPTVFFLILISIVYLQNYLNNGMVLNLVVSVLCYILSLLTYEIAIFCLLIYCIIAYNSNRSRKQYFKIILPYLVFTFLMVLFLFIYRIQTLLSFSFVEYNGLQIKYDLMAIIKTFCVQLFSPIPLSYMVYNTSLFSLKTLWRSILQTPHLYWITIFFILSVRSIRNMNFKDFQVKLSLRRTILGMTLWVLPAIPIALSQKYQSELRFGLGYLPVYIQYFGVLLCGVEVFAYVYHRIRNNRCRTILCSHVLIIIYVVSAINSINNVNVINRTNKLYYPHELFRTALKTGMLNDIEDNAIVVFYNGYTYDISNYEYLIYLYTNKRSRCIYKKKFFDKKSMCTQDEISYNMPKIYLVDFANLDSNFSYVKVGNFSHCKYGDDKRAEKIYISDISYFTNDIDLCTYMFGLTERSYLVKEVPRNVHFYRGARLLGYSTEFGDQNVEFDSIRLF